MEELTRYFLHRSGTRVRSGIPCVDYRCDYRSAPRNQPMALPLSGVRQEFGVALPLFIGRIALRAFWRRRSGGLIEYYYFLIFSSARRTRSPTSSIFERRRAGLCSLAPKELNRPCIPPCNTSLSN